MIESIILGILGFCVFLVYTSACLENVEEYSDERSGKIARFVSSISSVWHLSLSKKTKPQNDLSQSPGPPKRPPIIYCSTCNAKLQKYIQQGQEDASNTNNDKEVLSESTGGESAPSVFVSENGHHYSLDHGSKIPISTKSDENGIQSLQSSYNPTFLVSSNVPSLGYGKIKDSGKKFENPALYSSSASSPSAKSDNDALAAKDDFESIDGPNNDQPAVSKVETIGCYKSRKVGIFSKVGLMTGFVVENGPQNTGLVSSVLKVDDDGPVADRQKDLIRVPKPKPPNQNSSALHESIVFDDGLADNSLEEVDGPKQLFFDKNGPLLSADRDKHSSKRNSSIGRLDQRRKSETPKERRKPHKDRRSNRNEGERIDQWRQHGEKRHDGEEFENRKVDQRDEDDKCFNRGRNDDLRDEFGGDDEIIVINDLS